MNDSLRLQSRKQVLADFGASGSVADELLAYNRPMEWDQQAVAASIATSLPLADEPCAAIWDEWALAAERQGVWPVLQRYLPQLSFPIEAGMSQNPDYRAATLRGEPPEDLAAATGLQLESPGAIRLNLHPGLGGRLAVLYVPQREDFCSLVRALAKRNEPRTLPPSMGAIMISGLPNWTRISRYRANWEALHPGGNFAADGQPQMLQRKDQYLDRLMILGQSPYSNVAAEEIKLQGEPLDQARWLELSTVIRREHEATHHAVLRIVGVMRTNLHDELLADYMGICAAAGSFQTDWFQRFLGLENWPEYRAGGRFENYCGDLSDEARAVLAELLLAAARHVAQVDHAENPNWDGSRSRAATLLAMAALSLEELAAENAVQRLAEIRRQLSSHVPA